VSDRLPYGAFELWLQFGTPSDPEAMFCGLGVAVFPGEAEPFDVPDEVPTTGDMFDALGDVQVAIAAILSEDYTTGPGYFLAGTNDEPVRFDASPSFAGGTVGDAAPSNCALLLKKQSRRSGRRGRGRMYWPGIPEALVEPGGQVDSEHIVNVNVVLETILTRIVALGSLFATSVVSPALLHGPLHYTVGNAPTPEQVGDPIPGSGLPPDELLFIQVDGRIATQRRRLRR
jgi:hypothetical protein